MAKIFTLPFILLVISLIYIIFLIISYFQHSFPCISSLPLTVQMIFKADKVSPEYQIAQKVLPHMPRH